MLRIDRTGRADLGRHYDLILCLCLVCVTLLVYWQVRNHDFVDYDDDQYVYENTHVQKGLALASIRWAFTGPHSSNWHPLTSLSHLLDIRLFGNNPGPHHIVNLIFHIANSLILYIIFRRITKNIWKSLFVAALFALHPLHVESVAWISERKDVLSAFFGLLAIWCYVRYVAHPGVGRYLLVVLFFILGLMAKPMLVTLPFLLLLLDYWPLGRIKTISLLRIISEKIPLFALTTISCLITYMVQKQSGAVGSLDAIPLHLRAANAVVSYVGYIWKMLWPSKLAVLYPHPHELPWWKVMGAGLVLLSITTLALRHLRSRPYVGVGWFWYLGTLVPVIGLVQVGTQAMADRYSYIPLIGLSIMMAWGFPDLLEKWKYRKAVLTSLTAIILLVLMTGTFVQVGYWRDSITLFEHALAVTSKNYVVHNNLGRSLQRQDRLKEAEEHYREALRINPEYADAKTNLGLVLEKQGRLDEAIVQYEGALPLQPDHEKLHYNFGNALQKKGRIEEAIHHYQEALRVKPDYIKAHISLGVALERSGRTDEAVAHYKRALHLKPDYEKAHFNLATLMKARGSTGKAIEHYLEALRINPDYLDAHNNLGIIFQEQGRMDRAVKHYREVLRINPRHVYANYNLGNALLAQGRIEKAMIHYSEVLRMRPAFADAHNNMGVAFLQKGDLDGAIGHFREALRIKPEYVQAKRNLEAVLEYRKKNRNSSPPRQ